MKNKEKWWHDLPLSRRAVKAMREVDRLNGEKNPKFKNDSLEDFKKILEGRRLLMLRGVGLNTQQELCAVLGVVLEPLGFADCPRCNPHS